MIIAGRYFFATIVAAIAVGMFETISVAAGVNDVATLELSPSLRQRRLSYETIANFEPKSQVTDHNAIDLDQEAIEIQLAKRTEAGFQTARDIYTKGGHSKSVAMIALNSPLSSNIEIGTLVTGENAKGQEVLGKVYADYLKGTSTIGIQYKTTDIQKSYVDCQVGALPTPNTNGCLAASGTLNLKIDGADTTLSYTYDPAKNNVNKRTIQGFSTSAEEKMFRCKNCPYKTYRKFKDYYGVFDYADEWVNAAFEGRTTKFIRGNAQFGKYGYDGKIEAIKKGTAYMNVWMYVIRELEDALDDCKEGCTLKGCNDDPVHAWDEAVAFYTGSLQGKDGSGDGKLIYALANKRCANFATCGDLATDIEGTAHVNQELIIPSFALGSRLLARGQCAEAVYYKEMIEKMMVVPLIQGALRYAYATSTDITAGEKAESEGAVFAASVLPLVHACDEDAADTIYKNMKTGQGNTCSFKEVKHAFESVYPCLGIRGGDIGGIYNPETGFYFKGAEPLRTSSKVNKNIGLIIGCVAAGIVGGIFLYFIVSRLCCSAGCSSIQKMDPTETFKPSVVETVTNGDLSRKESDGKAATNTDGEVVEIS